MKRFSRRAAKTQREEKVNHEERLGEDTSPSRLPGNKLSEGLGRWDNPFS